MISVLGAAGTIGRNVTRFLEEWGAPVRRADFRLEGDEHVDARDPDSLRRSLSGADVCVNCLDYRLNLEVMEAALSSRTHYVDLGGLFHVTLEQLRLDDRFRDAGLTAILGMGSAPGKTNLLASAAVKRLGVAPDSLEIWAATRDPGAADHPFPAPYSVRTLLDELEMEPMVVKDGETQPVPPLSGEAEHEFPEPVGRTKGIYTIHSELATLPRAFPSLETASFRLCLSPGLLAKLLALEPGDEPEPYTQTAESVAVHVVEVGADGKRIEGMTITQGGSARSTSEPPARAAVEVAEGACVRRASMRPRTQSTIPKDSWPYLDTEVRWQ